MYRSWYVLGNEAARRTVKAILKLQKLSSVTLGEEAEHAAKFAELLGDCVWDTKTNLEKRMNAESGAAKTRSVSLPVPKH